MTVVAFSNRNGGICQGSKQVQNKPEEVASYPSMAKQGNSLLKDFAEAG